MSEKYGSSVLLLNGLAVCSMHLKRFAEAEKLLLQALEKVRRRIDTSNSIPEFI
jgi:hypothetical protein